jgi:hypothetical protein
VADEGVVVEEAFEEEFGKPKESHAHVTNQSFNKEHPSYDAACHNQALSGCDALHCALLAAQETRKDSAGVPSVAAAASEATATAGAAATAAPPATTTAAGASSSLAATAAGAASSLAARFHNKRGQGVWAQVRRIAASTFARLGADRRKFFTTPNTYEVFGLDFVVDCHGTAWLLEANPEPRSVECEIKSKGAVCSVTE